MADKSITEQQRDLVPEDIQKRAAEIANTELSHVKSPDDSDGKWLLSSDTGTPVLNAYERGELADQDHLTGLFNRRGFDKELQLLYGHCKRSGERLDMVFIDADDFKGVNSKYGHLGGDEVLKAIAQAMRDTFRSSDILARWGGDEFVDLSTSQINKEKVDADSLNQRLNDNLKKICPEEINKDDISVTLAVETWDGVESLYDFQSRAQHHMDLRK